MIIKHSINLYTYLFNYAINLYIIHRLTKLRTNVLKKRFYKYMYKNLHISCYCRVPNFKTCPMFVVL